MTETHDPYADIRNITPSTMTIVKAFMHGMEVPAHGLWSVTNYPDGSRVLYHLGAAVILYVGGTDKYYMAPTSYNAQWLETQPPADCSNVSCRATAFIEELKKIRFTDRLRRT